MSTDPRSPARRYIEDRMSVEQRILFLFFRIDMLERFRVPREAFEAEAFVDRCLHEFLDRGPNASRDIFEKSALIIAELRAAGWGPVTEVAGRIEEQRAADARGFRTTWVG